MQNSETIAEQRILLIDKDVHLRRSLKRFLSSKKYSVLESDDPFSAKNLLETNPVNLVISAIKFPYYSGLDLAEWESAHKKTPFILYEDFRETDVLTEAKKKGLTTLLTKPFNHANLLRTIAAILKGPQNADEKKPDAEDFCAVPVTDLITPRAIDFDIYVRLGLNHFVKIVYQGGRTEEARMKRYLEKGIRFFYIKKEDFAKVVGFNVTLSERLLSMDIDKEKKLGFLRSTGELLFQHCFRNDFVEEDMQLSKQFVANSLAAVSENPDFFMLFSALRSHSDYVYMHSTAVALVSVMIAQKLGWQSYQNLFRLCLAGLFHDIGKKELAKELLTKSRASMSSSERQIFESHALRGKEILESMKGVPSEVVAVAYEHHETLIGDGFPRGLKNKDIHPYAKIVALANRFCELSMSSPGEAGLPPKGAYERLGLYANTFDANAMNALGQLLI
jgi:putative nucleotidyltransferase with HDIG domain